MRTFLIAALVAFAVAGLALAGTPPARRGTPVDGASISPALVKADVVDAGVANVVGQLSVGGRVVINTLGTDGISFTDVNSVQRITWGNNVNISQHVASNRILLSGGYVGPNIALGSVGPGVLTDSATAPTIASGGCTSPTISANGTAFFRVTIGTSCTGVSTFTLTMPAATTAWHCGQCLNVSSGSANVRQSAAGSTTSVVITNYGTSAATPADWTAGHVIQCSCRGG